MTPLSMRRLLVANRGEIALRVIRSARRLGLETVAVYADADANAAFVRAADRAVRLGPSPPKESYLDPKRVLAAAMSSGADAVHPGYGFLSENAAFASDVIGAGLSWVGPPPSAIRAMGLKDAAKALMAAAGVPTTPGYLGEDQTVDGLGREADRLGYPLLIKAVAGGGGKGMRKVLSQDGFEAALAGAKREAAASFGDDRVLLEIYVQRPRHIEVQVFADRRGRVVHLFERDCTLQRRHQKVVEEAPAPGMDEATREAVTAAAVAAARAVGYEGAGTVEFIADGSAGLRGDRIWFMEMNTRLQVEHPVTEMATGLDLVEWQLRVADGQDLPLPQEEIRLKRFAMEARLYAENPAKGFLPSTGRLDHLRLPQTSDAVRVDAGVVQGDVVTPFYDPMIAKIIACGPTRDAASRALASACAEVEVWPVKTNAAFLVRCLRHPDFLSGDFDTGFIESRLGALTPLADPPPAVVARGALGLAASASEGESSSPWAFGALPGFRLNAEPVLEARLVFEGRIVTAPWRPQTPAPGGQGEAGIFLAGDDQIVVFDQGQAYALSADLAPGRSLGEARADGRILAPMPGRVVSVGGAVGDVIKKGQTLVVLEAMKMEHSLVAPFDGVLSSLEAASGVQVPEGAVLARLEKQR